jgi:recombination protein RecT
MSDANALMVVSKKAREQLDGWMPELSVMAQREYDKEAFKRSVVLAIAESANLTKCLDSNEGRISLYHALKFAAATGLSLNPQEGKAALIPYAGKIQYQVMKNGIIEVALRDPHVEAVMSVTVHANDEFKIKQTIMGDDFEFVPARTDRGDIDGFFASVLMKSGRSFVKYMTKQQVEEHRDRYSQAKTGTAWVKSFGPMGEKTVIKALFRTVKISPEVDVIVGADDKAEADMIDVTPVKSLEDQVVEEPVIEAEKVEEPKDMGQTIETPAMKGDEREFVEPPTEDGGLSEKQVGKIAGMCHVANIHKDIDQRAQVSEILGYSPVIAKLEYVPKASVNALYAELEKLNKEKK